jgi:hypothetical protein
LGGSLRPNDEPVLWNGIAGVRSHSTPFATIDEEVLNHERSVSPLEVRGDTFTAQLDGTFEGLANSINQTDLQSPLELLNNDSRSFKDSQQQERPTESHDNSFRDLAHATILELLKVLDNDDNPSDGPNSVASSTSSNLEAKVTKIFERIDNKMRDRENATQQATDTPPCHRIVSESPPIPEVNCINMKSLILEAVRASTDPEAISMSSEVAAGESQGQQTPTEEGSSPHLPPDGADNDGITVKITMQITMIFNL